MASSCFAIKAIESRAPVDVDAVADADADA